MNGMAAILKYWQNYLTTIFYFNLFTADRPTVDKKIEGKKKEERKKIKRMNKQKKERMKG